MRGMKACFPAAFLLGAALAAASAFGAGSNTLTPGATVVGTCKVKTAPGILNFGSIDPSGASNVTASTSFSMQCTKSTVSTAATDNGGANFSAGTKRMKHSVTATAFLPYTITYSGDTGFTGQGFGAATTKTVTVNGTITPAQFQNALVTTGVQIYSDTVTVTVNP